MGKRASYRYGVAWIAQNDEAGEDDLDVVAEMISVLLLADLFDKTPETVASDVLRRRQKEGDRA